MKDQIVNNRCTVWRWIAIEQGTPADYGRMKSFHYRGGNPGAIMRVFVARYNGPGLGGSSCGLLAGVVVESLPPLGCALREIAIPCHFAIPDRRLAAAKLNREMRTISRVVVHPMFRSTGLAVELVRHVLSHAQTPFVEALAAMGRVNPFFERAGMRAFDRPPRSDVVRLLAALDEENLRAIDLADPDRIRITPFLESELRRFARRKRAAYPDLLAEARERLLSQPVYYIWQGEPVVTER